jgi:hypothetical protein
MDHLARGRHMPIATLAAMFLAACSPAPKSTDTTTAKAARETRQAPGGLKPLDQPLDAIILDRQKFTAFLHDVEHQSPGQEIYNVKIAPAPGCTAAAKADLYVSSFATAGSYSYADLTIGSGAQGYPVARIENRSVCSPISIPIPPKSAGKPGVVFAFVALKNGGDPNNQTDYEVRLIDSTTFKQVGSALPFKACEVVPDHPWEGDHALAVLYADHCTHPALSTRLTATDIDDAWTLWMSCAANCCYADTGGTRGGPDTTHHDTTHRDTTHRDTTHRDSIKKPTSSRAT